MQGLQGIWLLLRAALSVQGQEYDQHRWLVFSDHWQGYFQRGERSATVDQVKSFAAKIHQLLHQLLNIQQQNIEQQHLSHLYRRQLTQINNISKYVYILVWTASVQTSSPPPPKEDRYCKTFQQFGYFCVPYYQCDIKTNETIIDGLNLIDIRTDYRGPDHGNITQSRCRKNIEVYCLHPWGTDPTSSGQTKKKTLF